MKAPAGLQWGLSCQALPTEQPLNTGGTGKQNCVQQGTQTAAVNGRIAIQMETKEKMWVFLENKSCIAFFSLFFTFFLFLQPSKKKHIIHVEMWNS